MSRRTTTAAYAGGVAAGVLALAALHASQLAPVPYPLLGSFQLRWTVVLVGLLIATAYSVGLPELPMSRTEAVLSSVVAVAVALVALSVVQLALGSQLLPRSVLALLVTLHPVWTLLMWNASRDLEHHQASRDRVVVVAELGEEAAALQADLLGRPERAAHVVSHLRPSQLVGAGAGALPLVDEVRAARATLLVLDAPALGDRAVVAQAAVVHQAGVRIRSMSGFYQEWLGKLPLSELEQASMLFDIGELHQVRYLRAKRLVDVVAASLGVPLLVAVGLVVWVCNRRWNPGPLLFRQERVGKHGEPFQVLKFRSMAPSAGDHRTWTSESDPRISTFGGLLRRTHLDELPQVVNILRGDLSVVGPRPEQLHYVDELRSKLAFYDARHLVRPGLTGWAQVKYGYAGSDADALEKLQYDLFYLRHQGLRFDLRIVARTLRHLSSAGGR